MTGAGAKIANMNISPQTLLVALYRLCQIRSLPFLPSILAGIIIRRTWLCVCAFFTSPLPSLLPFLAEAPPPVFAFPLQRSFTRFPTFFSFAFPQSPPYSYFPNNKTDSGFFSHRNVKIFRLSPFFLLLPKTNFAVVGDPIKRDRKGRGVRWERGEKRERRGWRGTSHRGGGREVGGKKRKDPPPPSPIHPPFHSLSSHIRKRRKKTTFSLFLMRAP